jgi:hypothetical protein
LASATSKGRYLFETETKTSFDLSVSGAVSENIKNKVSFSDSGPKAFSWSFGFADPEYYEVYSGISM